MGFRLIKEDTKEYRSYCFKKKQQELEKETIRWRNLTTHSSKGSDGFINHFHEVLSRGSKDFAECNALVFDLQNAIAANKLNIAKIQGNMVVDRLMELIVDISENSN